MKEDIRDQKGHISLYLLNSYNIKALAFDFQFNIDQ